MKKLILFSFLFVTFTCSSQSFKGFFKPVELSDNLKYKSLGAAASESSEWLFRPTVSLNAMKLQYVGGEQAFETSTLQTLGTGISYQQFVMQNDKPYCQLAINGLILYNIDYSGQVPINLGGAITVGAFNNLVSGGVGWDFNLKYPFILLNVSLNLNK